MHKEDEQRGKKTAMRENQIDAVLLAIVAERQPIGLKSLYLEYGKRAPWSRTERSVKAHLQSLVEQHKLARRGVSRASRYVLAEYEHRPVPAASSSATPRGIARSRKLTSDEIDALERNAKRAQVAQTPAVVVDDEVLREALVHPVVPDALEVAVERADLLDTATPSDAPQGVSIEAVVPAALEVDLDVVVPAAQTQVEAFVDRILAQVVLDLRARLVEVVEVEFFRMCGDVEAALRLAEEREQALTALRERVRALLDLEA